MLQTGNYPSGVVWINNCGVILNKLQLCNNMSDSHKHNIEQKKLRLKSHVVYNFIYLQVKKGEVNLCASSQDTGYLCWWQGREERVREASTS